MWVKYGNASFVKLGSMARIVAQGNGDLYLFADPNPNVTSPIAVITASASGAADQAEAVEIAKRMTQAQDISDFNVSE